MARPSKLKDRQDPNAIVTLEENGHLKNIGGYYVPAEGVYDFRVTNLDEREISKPKWEGATSYCHVTLEVMGTEQPEEAGEEYAGKPYRAFMFINRAGKGTTIYRDPNSNEMKLSKIGFLLETMGFEVQKENTYDTINWDGLIGSYLKGYVKYNPKTGIANVAIKGTVEDPTTGDITNIGLRPVVDTKHLQSNVELAEVIFGD